MKVVEKKTPEGKIRLIAEATSTEVNAALQAAQVAFAQSMGLSPEQDKTIAQAAEEHMGIKNLDSIVEASAMEALVPLALDKKNLSPSVPPKPVAKSTFMRNCPFSFEVEFTPKAHYELSSYDPVTITVPPFTFDEKAVDDQLEKIAQQYATYDAIDPRPITSGDTCLLTMDCFDEEGKPLKGLTSKGRTYVTGQGYMPEGFDKEIIGMQPGETKSFTFESPSVDEQGNECTQNVDCTVTIKEIQEPTVPEINDEWVEKNMPMYKDLDGLRRAISASVEGQAQQEYENYKMQLAVGELSKRFEGSIDDEVYEAMRSKLMNNLYSDLQQQGKTWEEFLEENGGEQQVGMMLMLQARDVLVQGFALDAVYRHEHLSLSDFDIDRACRTMNPGASPSETRQQLEQSGRGFALRETAERIKANQWVVDHAIINTSDGSDSKVDQQEI